MEESYVDTSKVSLRLIPKPLARSFIEKNHYSGRLSSCRYPIGIFYQSDNEHKFFDEKEEKLIGCIAYGYPIGRRVLGSIFKEDLELTTKNILELTRLVIYDGYGKNIESYVISQSFKWLKENASDVKVLISYADPEQNHAGGIYQATNWLYQGCGAIQMAPTFSLRLSEDEEWVHSRTVYSMYGSSNVEHLKRRIGHTFWLKKEAEKHRYLYFLSSKKDKRLFINNLKHPQLPYPKEAINKAEVTKHKVKEKGFYDK
jgi:hypothetical protein